MLPLRHQAQIIGIDKGVLHLKLERIAACGSCPAANYCGMGEKKEQILHINVADSASFSQGESVNLELNPRLGWLAVCFCYILPLILLLSTLFLCQYYTGNEIFSGIIAIIVLIPYFFILFLSKNFFKNKFAFQVTKD